MNPILMAVKVSHPISALTLAVLRDVSQGRPRPEGLVGRPQAGPCIYSEARDPDLGDNSNMLHSTLYRSQQQGETHVPGLVSRLLFGLPFQAVGISQTLP